MMLGQVPSVTATVISQPGLLPPVEALTRGFVLLPAASPSSAPLRPLPAVSPVQLSAPAVLAAGGMVSNGAGLAESANVQRRQGFMVGELRLMIAYDEGSELTALPDVCRIPNAPVWFLGMVNLHGVIIPVFDLAAYLSIQSASSGMRQRMLLVLGHGADAAGVLIDSLPQRLSWDGDTVSQVSIEAAPEKLQPLVRGVHMLESGMWFDLETGALLQALEHAVQGM